MQQLTLLSIMAKLVGSPLFAPPRPEAVAHAASVMDPTESELLMEAALTPTAVWLTEWSAASDPEAAVRAILAHAAKSGETAVLVAYMIPARDMGQFSAGGADASCTYLRWVDGVASAVSKAEQTVAIILEPDALAHAASDGFGDDARASRLALLREAYARFSASGAAVYCDAGHPRWLPKHTAATLLKEVGARRFSINVSNFVSLAECTEYGSALAGLLGAAPAVSYVVDVGRCGRGAPADGAWCNPPGRALGPAPTTVTGEPGADAFLWIKPPGESDGEADGAPAAGRYMPQYALELARARAFDAGRGELVV